MAAGGAHFQAAGDARFHQRTGQTAGMLRIHQLILGGHEDGRGREGVHMVGNLVYAGAGFLHGAAHAGLGKGVLVGTLVPAVIVQKPVGGGRIDGEAHLRLGHAVSGIARRGVPQANDIAAGGEAAGHVPVRVHMENVLLLPDDGHGPGDILHGLHRRGLHAHPVGKDEHMIAPLIEMAGYRPAFRQAPHVDESAAGHQQQEGAVIGGRVIGGEVDEVHIFLGRVGCALLLRIQLVVEMLLFSRRKQAHKAPVQHGPAHFVGDLLQCPVVEFLLGQIPFADGVRRNIGNGGVFQQGFEGLLHIHRVLPPLLWLDTVISGHRERRTPVLFHCIHDTTEKNAHATIPAHLPLAPKPRRCYNIPYQINHPR